MPIRSMALRLTCRTTARAGMTWFISALAAARTERRFIVPNALVTAAGCHTKAQSFFLT
jgi:hypothetical protein